MLLSLIIVACAAVIGVVILSKAIDDANHEIDLCSDQTSGKYIWNKADREKACRREPIAKNSN